MPFGLDFKSIILGVVIAYFVVPRVMGLVNRPRGTATV